MSMITPMRFSPDDSTTPFHSSAYAHAAQGERLGSVSVQSYGERLQLERNRRHVRCYGHSRLGQTMSEIRPLTMPARPETARVQRIERPGGGQVASAQHTFREPTARYDPYR